MAKHDSMKRILRPAFVATGIALSSCTPQPHLNPPPPAPAATEAPAADPAADAAYKKKYGVHPRDAEHRLIFRQANGKCYVEVPKAGPPPPNMMSGERWTEHKDVVCPKQFDEPAFAAIEDGMYWLQDEATGECSQAPTFGNPPPPPKVVPCPPSLKK